MAKDVNIHVKTTGTKQAAQDMTDFYAAMRDADKDIAAGLKGTGNAAEEMGVKSSRAVGWLKEAFTALVGPLGIAAGVGLAVAAVRKIISAFDDMKRASAEAVQELANQQRAAASFFESVNAYSGPQRKVALAQARGVQAATGLPFESSMKLLEAQQRTFGEINPQSTEQFAAYWKLHAGEQTGDLIRWMGASGIKTPEQQGQIMRMIGAVANKGNLKDEDIITALSNKGERLRYMGWSPEETITNIGKALSGLSGTESSKAMRGLLESFEGFDEAKAREMRAPPDVASNEQARFEWLKSKAQTMAPEKRAAFIRQAFGPAAAPYITKMLFEPTSPELQQAIDYAKSPQAAAESVKQAADYRETAEGTLERARGGAGIIGLNVTNEQQQKAALREYGKAYYESLQAKNPLEYLRLTRLGIEEKIGIGTETFYERAAIELWRTQHPATTRTAMGRNGAWGPVPVTEPQSWDTISLKERLSDIEQAANQINQPSITEQPPQRNGNTIINTHYHNETVYNPVAGNAADRDIGPRAGRDFK
jgi:hypothetical protein